MSDLKDGIKSIDAQIRMYNGQTILIRGNYKEDLNSFDLVFKEPGKDEAEINETDSAYLADLFGAISETFSLTAAGEDVHEKEMDMQKLKKNRDTNK